MTRQEFDIVEFFYMDLNMNKDSFCTAYQKNTDGFATKIQREFYEEKFKKERGSKQEILALQNQLKKFSKESTDLRKKIERLQCWTLYENSQCFSDKHYKELYECIFAEKLSEEKAIEVITYTLGFSPEKISILTKAKVYEINRDKEFDFNQNYH